MNRDVTRSLQKDILKIKKRKKEKSSQLYNSREFSLKYRKRSTSSEEDVIQAGSGHMKCLLKKMSFGVTTDDAAGRIICQVRRLVFMSLQQN